MHGQSFAIAKSANPKGRGGRPKSSRELNLPGQRLSHSPRVLAGTETWYKTPVECPRRPPYVLQLFWVNLSQISITRRSIRGAAGERSGVEGLGTSGPFRSTRRTPRALRNTVAQNTDDTHAAVVSLLLLGNSGTQWHWCTAAATPAWNPCFIGAPSSCALSTSTSLVMNRHLFSTGQQLSFPLFPTGADWGNLRRATWLGSWARVPEARVVPGCCTMLDDCAQLPTASH